MPTNGRDPDAVFPKTWSWNVGVEHEIVNNTKVEVMYVGTAGRDQLHFWDANQVSPANRLDYARTATGGPGGAFRPYSAVRRHGHRHRGHTGASDYHSLQTQLVSRFGRGSQFQASYTWSKSTGNLGLDDSGSGNNADNNTSDLANPDLDWGPTRINRPHLFNASLILMLPTLEEKGGLTKMLFGDWEVAAIAAYSSGQSLTVYTTSIPGLNGGPSGLGLDAHQKPNVTGQSCAADGGLDEQILNPAAFTLAGYQIGSIGNEGRGFCSGPDYMQLDLSLYKNIRITDRVKAQLRFEVFNVFNRSNFLLNGLNNTFNPSAVTYDTGSNATATTITGFSGIPGNFGQATQTRDPRQAQFGIKLTF